MSHVPPPLPPVVPEAKELVQVLTDLVGKTVVLRSVVGTPKPAVGPQFQALYRDDEGAPRVLCTADLPFVAGLAAALAMMPPAAAKDVAKSGQLSELLLDCAREVLNVTAKLLNQPGGVHVVLRDVAVAPKQLPADIRAALLKAPSKKEYTLDLLQYASGKLSFYAL